MKTGHKCRAVCLLVGVLALCGCSEQNPAQEKNAFGGVGEIKVLLSEETLVYTDDSRLYCYYNCAARQSATSEEEYVLQSLCTEPVCRHDETACLEKQYKNKLISDGTNMYLIGTGDAVLYRLSADGKTKWLELSETADGEKLDKSSVLFENVCALGDTGCYFVSASAMNKKQENVKVTVLYEPEQGSIRYITGSYNGYAARYYADTGLLYVITSEGTLAEINPETAQVRDVLDGIDYMELSTWGVSHGVLYYINWFGQYCSLQLDTQTKTVIDETPFWVSGSIYNDKLYYTAENGILCANCDGSEPQVLYSTSDAASLTPVTNDDYIGFVRYNSNGIWIFRTQDKGVMHLAPE